jgi:hypothetical protein
MSSPLAIHFVGATRLRHDVSPCQCVRRDASISRQVLPRCPNVVAHWAAEEQSHPVLFEGHLDTVEVAGMDVEPLDRAARRPVRRSGQRQRTPSALRPLHAGDEEPGPPWLLAGGEHCARAPVGRGASVARDAAPVEGQPRLRRRGGQRAHRAVGRPRPEGLGAPPSHHDGSAL